MRLLSLEDALKKAPGSLPFYILSLGDCGRERHSLPQALASLASEILRGLHRNSPWSEEQELLSRYAASSGPKTPAQTFESAAETARPALASDVNRVQAPPLECRLFTETPWVGVLRRP